MSYPYSFNGVGMDIEVEPAGDEIDSDVSPQHIPGSNITYLDVGGANENHKTYKLFFLLTSDYQSLRGQVGNTGTLVDIDGTFNNVYFKRLGRARKGQGSGWVNADAEFWVGS